MEGREKQMQQKLCYATTKHDFTRQEMYASKLMSWKVVKSREKQMQQKNCVMQRQNTTLHDKICMQANVCREKS